MDNKLTIEIAELQTSIGSLELEFRSKNAMLKELERKIFHDPDDSLSVAEIVRGIAAKDAAVAENKAAIAALKPELETLEKDLTSKRNLLQRREALKAKLETFFAKAKHLDLLLRSAQAGIAELQKIRAELNTESGYHEVFGARMQPLEISEEFSRLPRVVVRPETGTVRFIDGMPWNPEYKALEARIREQEASANVA
jgi:DNA repair exonuclease SbcCD ATPase subunit